MKNDRDMERCLKAAYDRIAKGAPLCRQIEGNVKGRRGMDAVLERGEQEYRGYILLPGTENRPCFVGDPPLWKENPVGDEEYVWGLNRYSQWKDYILCYCATGERKYLERIRLELTDPTWTRPLLTSVLMEKRWSLTRGASLTEREPTDVCLNRLPCIIP